LKRLFDPESTGTGYYTVLVYLLARISHTKYGVTSNGAAHFQNDKSSNPYALYSFSNFHPKQIKDLPSNIAFQALQIFLQFVAHLTLPALPRAGRCQRRHHFQQIQSHNTNTRRSSYQLTPNSVTVHDTVDALFENCTPAWRYTFRSQATSRGFVPSRPNSWLKLLQES
jgi:hypothetical protein